MVCCLASMAECDQHHYDQGWEGVTMADVRVSGGLTHVRLDLGGSCQDSGLTSGLAYLWLETPCVGEAACPLYAADQYRLPVAPFRMTL